MVLTQWKEEKSCNGYGALGIVLIGGDARILSVVKEKDGILFTEECDGLFAIIFQRRCEQND
jgi:hypothetical protein